jgi:hypothetical protein
VAYTKMNDLPKGAALSLIMTISLSTLCQTRSAMRFDAAWWARASSEEQQGFIYGYRDCRQPSKAPLVPVVDEQTFISNEIKSKGRKAPDAVTTAIVLSWKTLNSQTIPKGAEVFTGPHGFLDGGWWGGFSGRPWPPDIADEDRGYLEGYLACSSPPVYAKSVRHYQLELNRHYASGRHDGDKIADVLMRLAHPKLD